MAPATPDKVVDMTVNPEEAAAIEQFEKVKDKTDTKTDDTKKDDKTTPVKAKPFLYHDLAKSEASMGWCCERAGGDEIDCGERTIGGKKIALEPDAHTPKSTDFASIDLALIACMQKTDNCGKRNQTISAKTGPITLTGKSLSEDNSCSWIVKVECGLPTITVKKMSTTLTDVNTKILYVEWQSSLMENHAATQWAPHSKQVIPKMFDQ